MWRREALKVWLARGEKSLDITKEKKKRKERKNSPHRPIATETFRSQSSGQKHNHLILVAAPIRGRSTFPVQNSIRGKTRQISFPYPQHPLASLSAPSLPGSVSPSLPPFCDFRLLSPYQQLPRALR
ncbi:hypothetical protein E2C01_066481 [Portunus trituberculatus]|uniref:Uncharacterized protein n=1 Tax=Portunus trituberculatus TaxID=210409 RepID=A0A5B7HUS7_PORTR|nr:hypothetical protein [Portunus trituberculatus]